NELWDGIKRDRLVWIGDLSPELKTVKYVWGDVPQVYNALALSAHNTVLPAWINGIATYSLWWIINLEEWIFYTGKREYLWEQREYFISLTRQILENVDEDGNFTASDFIDWPSKGYPSAKAGAKALLLLCLRACEKLLSVLGEEELKEKCASVRKLAERKKEACGDLKQIASLLLLSDIADGDCTECLKKGGAEGFSTFMSYYILTGMSKCCSEEEILDALKTYYGAMLDLGATTFWEDFDIKWMENACRLDEICKEGQTDIHGDCGKYCYQGYRHSLCHGWSSGPVAFLTEYVLGIRIIGEGCSKIEIKPHLGALKYVRGSIATPFGKLTVEHRKNADGSTDTKIEAPTGIEMIQ
ncbi:MAG: alpha-L-rhamnosidase, partial [Clostridia bacterium]|nr:alpha-L-rhamnosidase [Clostridia bacterium]